jgi:hypothetical protein
MDLGTHPENLIVGRPVLAPPTLFRTAKPLDLSGLARDLGESSEYRYIGPTKTTSPLILIYGKLGQYKGTAELVAAAERLQDRGLDLCLLFVTGQGEPAFERLLKDVEDKGLGHRFIAIPYLPPWRVTEFLAASSVVAFLENRFPITIHRPQIPREAMTAGKCVVLTKEVASYQQTSVPLIDGENVLLVEDALNIDSLADKLADALDPDIRSKIGKNAKRVYSWPTTEAVAGWANRLLEAIDADYEQKETQSMAIADFNAALVRLYADRDFRMSVRDQDPVLPSERLTDHETRSLVELSMDEESLERYCRSILIKKYHFLRGPFSRVFARNGNLGDSVRSTFMAEWVLDDAGIPSDFRRFKETILSCLDRGFVGYENQTALRDQVDLIATRSEVLYSQPPTGAGPDKLEASEGLYLAPPHRFLRLAQHPSRPDERPWNLLIERDREAFTTNLLELTPATTALFEVLAQRAVPTPEAIDRMVEATGVVDEGIRYHAEQAILGYVRSGLIAYAPT